jgi:hypothetical protein
MKHTKWIFAVMLIALSGLAAAQSASPRIVAQVPFDFMVSNKTIPAGEIVLKSDNPEKSLWLVRNTDAKAGLFSLASVTDQTMDATNTLLTFHRYGNQYFLSEIRVEGSNVSYQLPETKAETEIRARNLTPADSKIVATLK